MSARVQITGLSELIHAITSAPEEIREEARGIIRDTTEAAARDIAQGYPEKTGRLRRRVKTAYPSSDIVVGIVQSSAPHSHLYEWGTAQRKTDSGANRGRMPEKNVTPPIARRHRDAMFGRLAAMLRRRGWVVDGV